MVFGRAPFALARFVRASSLALAASAVAACGGAAPNAAAPSSAEPVREPTTIEEAESQIAAANRELGGDTGSSESSAAPSTPPAARPEERPSLSAEAPTSTSSGGDAARSACDTPCRALRSMRVAVAALCRMTGDADGRCDGARKKLAASEARASGCSC